MAKIVKQYRYYSDQDVNNKNYPENLLRKNLRDGDIFFADGLAAITQLGIQTLPGTRFKLNKGEDIIVGSTGIYELNIDGISEINELSFNDESLQIIENSGSAFLIVDALYETEED